MTDSQRPTKKQRELLSFIDNFIKGSGYGPSYREVMRALDYKSVSTVATHIDGLIARGYLRKTDHSARSLEVVGVESPAAAAENPHITWLKKEIQRRDHSDDEAVQREKSVLEQALGILDKTTS